MLLIIDDGVHFKEILKYLGIGLGLVKEYLKLGSVKHVFATARNPEQAEELSAIKDNRLHVLKMEVQDDKAIRAAYEQVDRVVGDEGLNLLINNAGIGTAYPVDAEPNRDAILNLLNTNSCSPLVISQVFLPLLRRSAQKHGDEWGAQRAAIVNISSGLGSITENTSGSGHFNAIVYRMSKAALNQMTKTLAVDLEKEGILSVSFCPGWVQTNLGGQNAALTVDQSVEPLVKTISTLGHAENGGYFKRNGERFQY